MIRETGAEEINLRLLGILASGASAVSPTHQVDRIFLLDFRPGHSDTHAGIRTASNDRATSVMMVTLSH
jgi:hypothetical protein